MMTPHKLPVEYIATVGGCKWLRAMRWPEIITFSLLYWLERPTTTTLCDVIRFRAMTSPIFGAIVTYVRIPFLCTLVLISPFPILLLLLLSYSHFSSSCYFLPILVSSNHIITYLYSSFSFLLTFSYSACNCPKKMILIPSFIRTLRHVPPPPPLALWIPFLCIVIYLYLSFHSSSSFSTYRMAFISLFIYILLVFTFSFFLLVHFFFPSYIHY